MNLPPVDLSPVDVTLEPGFLPKGLDPIPLASPNALLPGVGPEGTTEVAMLFAADSSFEEPAEEARTTRYGRTMSVTLARLEPDVRAKMLEQYASLATPVNGEVFDVLIGNESQLILNRIYGSRLLVIAAQAVQPEEATRVADELRFAPKG